MLIKITLSIFRSLGGKILIGGKQKILDGDLADGYYIEPTIIEGLNFDCSVNQEEIFWPSSIHYTFFI